MFHALTAIDIHAFHEHYDYLLDLVVLQFLMHCVPFAFLTSSQLVTQVNCMEIPELTLRNLNHSITLIFHLRPILDTFECQM